MWYHTVRSTKIWQCALVHLVAWSCPQRALEWLPYNPSGLLFQSAIPNICRVQAWRMSRLLGSSRRTQGWGQMSGWQLLDSLKKWWKRTVFGNYKIRRIRKGWDTADWISDKEWLFCPAVNNFVPMRFCTSGRHAVGPVMDESGRDIYALSNGGKGQSLVLTK